MKKLTAFTLIFSLLIGYSCKQSPESKGENNEVENPTMRIVTLSGSLTETVSALGYEDAIVGVDVTSTFPENIKKSATDLGHISSITIESVLSLKPTDVLAIKKELNPELLDQLQKSNINVHLFEQEYSIDGTKRLISEVAKAIDAQDYKPLFETIDSAIKTVTSLNPKPKVVFIYARGAGTLMVAGTNTPMEQLVNLAGGEYAITGFESFKPLTPESLVQANPDVLFLFDSGLQSLGGVEGLMGIPGVAETKAAKNNAIITMDGALASAFGPSVGKAILEFNQLLKKYN